MENNLKCFESPAGLTIIQALEKLHLPDNSALVAVVNGMTVDLTYALKPGDEIHLFPQIAGG